MNTWTGRNVAAGSRGNDKPLKSPQNRSDGLTIDLPSAYRCITMQTIQEVAKALGLSTRAVYRRLDAFNGKLDGYLTRGINNEILFNSSALALLRRLEDLRTAEGIPIRQAVARVSEELDGNSARPVQESNGRLMTY